MKSYIILLLSVIVLSCNDKSTTTTSVEGTEALNYLKKEMKEQGIPGLQISIIKNNEIVLSESLGLANVPFSVEVKGNTIFSINSIAKVFASTAILQLEEQGKLTLSDSIGRHILDLPGNWNSVTIKQLLSHTSGLPDIEDPDKDELVGGKGQGFAWALVQKMPLQFPPGEDFSYNATNYLLLQKVVEKYSEVPFEEFVKIKQFDIAGMKEIIYGNSADVTKNKSPTYCYYYINESTGELVKGVNLIESKEEFPTILRADAGAFTTASEMSKWVIALQSGKLLKKESIDKMWTPTKLNNGKYGGFDQVLNGYALGWPVMKRQKHPAAVPIGGGRASLAIYTEDNLAIILFTNLSGIYAHKMIDDVAEFYFIN